MEIELGGKRYTTHKLNVMDAWELHRKVDLDIVNALSNAANIGQSVAILTAYLSRLDTKDANRVFSLTLSHVSRDDHKNKVLTNGVLAYEDIGLFALDALIAMVIKETFGGFTSELVTYLPDVTTQKSSGENSAVGENS